MIGVCIVTYNQEKYIAQAIESVLVQKDCPEKIHIYIGEDCSSDGTLSICNEFVNKYPDMITLIENDENLGLVRNTIKLLKAIIKDGCNYIAMLDGDDYWCDPLKLCKQIEFLNLHPEYGFVHTRNYVLVDNKLITPDRPTPPTGDVFNTISSSYPIANCTVLFRTTLLNFLQLEDLTTRGFMSLDYVMYVIFSSITLFGFLEDYTAVWRRGHSSVSNTKDKDKQIRYLNNDKAMWQYLSEKFPNRFPFSDDRWNRYYDYMVFNIAYRFRDYPLAHSLVNRVKKHKGFIFKIKVLCARNKALFNIWTHCLHHPS